MRIPFPCLGEKSLRIGKQIRLVEHVDRAFPRFLVPHSAFRTTHLVQHRLDDVNLFLHPGCDASMTCSNRSAARASFERRAKRSHEMMWQLAA